MVAFAIRGPIARADLPGLSARVCALLEHSLEETVLCDVSAVEPDAVTVEAVARLQLGARRHGRRVVLCGASPRLCELIAFLGLTDVISPAAEAGRTAGTPGRCPGRT
jgi:ABC-type transporter Mla MlaB component